MLEVTGPQKHHLVFAGLNLNRLGLKDHLK